MTDPHHFPPVISELEDADIRTAILQLNQKLKSLQLELKIKLATFDKFSEEAVSHPQKQQLTALADEVNRALKSLESVVHIATIEKMSPHEFKQRYQDELHHLREIAAANVETIEKIHKALD